MASTNFVVHLVAAIALLITFYVIAKYTARMNLLKDLFVRSSAKRLLDPVKLFMAVFDIYDIDYSYEKVSTEVRLISLPDFGDVMSRLKPVEAQVYSDGQTVKVKIKVLPTVNLDNIETSQKKLFELTGVQVEVVIL